MAISTERLSKRYGSTLALDELTLQVRDGEVFGFLGPNGAGKTTTIRLLLGLLRPSAGTAMVLGLDPWRDMVDLHARLVYVPGDLALWPNLTGAQTIELLGRLHGSFDTGYRDELIERFDLDPTKRIRSYSRGNRQKVGIVAALMTRAELLLLDEPTAGLDPLMEQVFRGCVREASGRGQTVFLSSHILAEVEAVCDRVGLLREGRLIEVGPIDRLRGMTSRLVHARFSGEPPDLRGLPGVDEVVIDGSVLRCQVSGPVAPVVDALAGSGLVDLEIREASLEELFLSRYGNDA